MCSRKHVLLSSWLVADLFAHLPRVILAEAQLPMPFVSGSLVWSPDGQKLFLVGQGAAGTIIMDFQEN